MTKIAIIKAGGKQHLVSLGDKIKINPPLSLKKDIEGASAKGKEMTFDKVLLLQDGKEVSIGSPYVKDAKVTGKVVKVGKEDKVIVFKYKPKTRQATKKGHRQPFVEIEITKI